MTYEKIKFIFYRILVIGFIIFIGLLVFDVINISKSDSDKSDSDKSDSDKSVSDKLVSDKSNDKLVSDKSNDNGVVGLSGSLKNDMLSLHNKVRAKNGARDLKWSNELAAGAQKWVDYLKNNESCRMRHPTKTQQEMNKYLNNNKWGQNIAWFSGSEGSPQRCIDGWVNRECPNYNPGNPGDKSKGEIGHYTQVVWKNTTDVGCAKASCGNQTLWACDYNPSGNIRMNGGFSEYAKNVEKNC